MLPSDADLNIAVDWLARVARGPGDLPNRLDRLARAFVTPPTGNAQPLWDTVRSLLGDVQYIVFNIPAHLAEEQRRHFVAVLKPLPSPEDYAWSGTREDISEADICDVYIAQEISMAPMSVPPNQLVEEWKWVWKEYARLTYALEAKRTFTWNQFLLHGCADPQPFGLSWTGAREGSTYYLHADDQILSTLGIEVGARRSVGAWNAALAKLPPRLDDWPRLPAEVVERHEALTPFDDVDVEATAAASIYHLLRSYGRWGGGAFLSIPVVLAAGAERTTSAVLSVCSDAPMSAEAVLRWRLLAKSVLPVIASSELVTQFHLRTVAEAVTLEQAEAWAHEVKNRTEPIITCLARASAADLTLDTDATRALHGALILNSVSYAVHRALGNREELQPFDATSGPPILEAVLQYLLNYRAASILDVVTWSPRWSVEECVLRLGTLLGIVREHHSLGDHAQRVLVHPKIVLANALLREIVQNVRINDSVEGDRRIRITYSVQRTGDAITVELQQRQKESTVIRPELGRGIKATNHLFGERLGLGRLEVDAPEKIAPASASGGWEILIRSRAIVALGGER